MKILILSDIHANIWALDTVLRKEKAIDMICCAGDYTDYGIAPAETIARIREWKKPCLVFGNHDIHVLNTYKSGEWRHTAPGEYKWVHYNCERLSGEEAAWLEALPETAYFEADGWKYLVRHQYGSGYETIESSHAFDCYWKEKTGRDAVPGEKRRAIFGHTHRQCIHILNENTQWINPGSISYRRPDDPDKTAHYATVTDGRVELKRIAYDRSALLAEAEKYIPSDKMMRTEIQDFRFFFGDAVTSRDPL